MLNSIDYHRIDQAQFSKIF